MIKVFFIKYKLKSKFKKKNKKYTKHLIEEFKIFDNSKNIGLFPYNAWDCLAIYKVFCKFYKKSKFLNPNKDANRKNIMKLEKEIIKIFNPKSKEKDFIKIDSFINDINNLFEKINQHLKIDFKIYSYIGSYGIIDSLIKNFELDALLNGFTYDEELLFEKINSIAKIIDNTCRPFDKIIIAETAYLECSFLRAYSFANKIPLYCLHPNGTFRKLSSDFLPSESFVPYESKNIIGQNSKIPLKQIENLAKSYFSKRLKGEASDSDSKYAFQNYYQKTNLEFKKVLFLHCLRDANNINSGENNFFKTYIEWTNFSLSQIKYMQNEWWIKIHPMSNYWKDDIKLVKILLKKNNIDPKLCLDCPNTLDIIKNGMPIFTCNGTVALESLAFGNYSLATGDRLSSLLIKKINNLDTFKSYLFMSPEKLRKEIQASKELTNLAKVLLMDTKSRCDLEHFFALKYIQLNDSLKQKLDIIFTLGNKKHDYI